MEDIEIKEIAPDIVEPDATEEFISKRLTKMELSLLRKSKGISQKEMAKVSGLSTQCISDIENPNGGNPTLKSIVRYLECLGYEISFQKKNI
jgi:transcriptional regulator with XRE-family HTH domain